MKPILAIIGCAILAAASAAVAHTEVRPPILGATAHVGTAIYAFAHNIGHDGHKPAHAYISGGGGGAGDTYDTSTVRNGQDGLSIDITGQSTYYAGGGSGDNGWARTPANGGLGGGGGRSQAGTDGLGGGGGGGAKGGSGVVIIRYRYEPGFVMIIR